MASNIQRAMYLLIGAMALIAICCVPGCVVFTTYRDVPVTVIDAETQEPITGARVSVEYLTYLVLNPPRTPVVSTDANGRATLKVASFQPRTWLVWADGYLPFDSFYSEPASPPDFRLYRQPKPRITVVVPNGYTGPLLVDVHLLSDEWIQERIGKRSFQFYANSQGYVRIDATPLLTRFPEPIDLLDIPVRYQNGAAIPRDDGRVASSQIALRWIPLDIAPYRTIFVIGNRDDGEELRNRLTSPLPKGGAPSNQTAIDDLFEASSHAKQRPAGR